MSGVALCTVVHIPCFQDDGTSAPSSSTRSSYRRTPTSSAAHSYTRRRPRHRILLFDRSPIWIHTHSVLGLTVLLVRNLAERPLDALAQSPPPRADGGRAGHALRFARGGDSRQDDAYRVLSPLVARRCAASPPGRAPGDAGLHAHVLGAELFFQASCIEACARMSAYEHVNSHSHSASP